MYTRYVLRVTYEHRTRRRNRVIFECCDGYRRQGNECPIGKVDIFKKPVEALINKNNPLLGVLLTRKRE